MIAGKKTYFIIRILSMLIALGAIIYARQYFNSGKATQNPDSTLNSLFGDGVGDAHAEGEIERPPVKVIIEPPSKTDGKSNP